MNNKDIDLAVSCYGATKDQLYEMAILPWGATEPHNYHLPYLTDCILSHDVSVDAARLALEKYGVRAMVLPYITMGSQNPGQRELKFCIHARYETQKAILTDIVESLSYQGINKLLIVCGHGGNNFRNMIRDLAVDYPSFIIAVSNWYALLPAKEYFDNPGDHADELETSVMMHYHPELVNLSEAGTGESHPFAIPTLRDKVAWIPRNWSKVSFDTGIGDPSLSTATKGRRYSTDATEKYAQFIQEFSRCELY